MAQTRGKGTYPYVPFDCFLSCIEELASKSGRVSPNFFSWRNVQARGQMVRALHFFGLIDAGGYRQTSLDELVRLSRDERARRYRALIAEFYPFVGESCSALEHMSTADLESHLQAGRVAGQTLRKGASFLLNLAMEAGITINPDLRVTGMSAKGRTGVADGDIQVPNGDTTYLGIRSGDTEADRLGMAQEIYHLEHEVLGAINRIPDRGMKFSILREFRERIDFVLSDVSGLRP